VSKEKNSRGEKFPMQRIFQIIDLRSTAPSLKLHSDFLPKSTAWEGEEKITL
jgi:hypothetical protein